MRDFRYKVDERDVPPSRHALFIRGLSPEISRDRVQKFFEEIGPCEIVFYKQLDRYVCTAVRFDDRDDAKKCYREYEGKKLLNCKVEITWYRDVRAYVRKMDNNKYQSSRGRHYRYDKYNKYKRRSRSKNSRHSPNRAVSISSDESGSPKRKHRRKSSQSSSEHNRRSSSSSSSSATHRSHEPSNPIGPYNLATGLSSDFSDGSNFIKVEEVGENKNIGLIILSRPSAANAFCTASIYEFFHQLTKLDNDKSIGAIIVTGDNQNFSSGFVDSNDLTLLDKLNFYEDDISMNWKQIWEIKKPLIAAVNGDALGLGCELALSCDIVYAGTEAQFGQPEISSASMPSFGGTQLLTRAVGKSLTMEMCLTGARLNAEDALKRGLVSKIFPVDQVVDETIKLAESIVKNSSFANAMIKKSVNYAFESFLQAGLTFERHAFYSLQSNNFPKADLSTSFVNQDDSSLGTKPNGV